MSADSAAPSPAPVRELCPGIVVSADTCSGEPRIAGTRTPTVLPAEFATHAAYTALFGDTVNESEFVLACAFEAGRAWERERRQERKRKRLAKRWRQGQQAAEGEVSDAR